MSKTQVTKKVKKYGQLLRRHGFAFSHLYLFGSAVTGTARAGSDIDVAVVMKRKPRDFFEREGELWALAPRVDSRIEPVLLTEVDLKSESASIIGSEVSKRGVKVM